MKQVHLFYSGRVQGVGFRFTAADLARQRKVCGWVKNLADGRVELVAQADEHTLRQFLADIKAAFSEYIRDVKMLSEEPEAGLNSFRIAF